MSDQPELVEGTHVFDVLLQCEVLYGCHFEKLGALVDLFLPVTVFNNCCVRWLLGEGITKQKNKSYCMIAEIIGRQAVGRQSVSSLKYVVD